MQNTYAMKRFIYTASFPDEQPANLLEQLTLAEATDGQGRIAIQAEKLEDTPRLKRWYGEGTWVKMRHTRHTSSGVIVIHYFQNIDTSQRVGFKFKKRLPENS